MELEEAIYAKLIATSAVTDLVGTRIYPVQAPQSSTLPVVIYGQAFQKRVQSLTGCINLNQYSLRLDLWSNSYATAKALYHALRDTLLGYQGDLAGGVTVNGIFEDGGDDGAEPPAHDEETGLFTAGIDLAIWYGV